ncbi:hypothetical protein [Streptomyces chryseus]|uniref:Uncharacterized protein n=1 Tax=Streptomyces chryseus TaxID=68186 RepID=A0ABQ3DHY9_9ACTN|nr:hypothetical protein [Streptomyces chryseus]GGX37820.1 hypothetical protein GCM10010353_61610 [Streptomyces chryseus]GHA94813.1 hypothetical protein GCM10010346_17050 [Streptomyces chryseus]
MTVQQVTTGEERRLAVEHWLSSASPDPAQTRRDWVERSVVMLSCGSLFAAVRIPAEVVQAAARTTDEAVIDTYLAGALMDGPVIRDRYAHWYYALVPASTARGWDVPDTVCLGVGTSLGVPRPGLCAAGERVYWAVPMDSAASLCSPHAVSQLVMTGRYRAAGHG